MSESIRYERLVISALRNKLEEPDLVVIQNFTIPTSQRVPRELDLVIASRRLGVIVGEFKRVDGFSTKDSSESLQFRSYIQDGVTQIRKLLSENQLEKVAVTEILFLTGISSLIDVDRKIPSSGGSIIVRVDENNPEMFLDEILGEVKLYPQLNDREFNNLREILNRGALPKSSRQHTSSKRKSIDPTDPRNRFKVFISYRRSDSAWQAGRIYEYLSSLPRIRDQIFWDTKSIDLGDDWRDSIDRALQNSVALLVVIGATWLTVTSQMGRRRIDTPGDMVVYEISKAISERITVIPILIDGAEMPNEESLPDEIKSLAHRQALQISWNNFDSEIERLTQKIYRLIEIGEQR